MKRGDKVMVHSLQDHWVKVDYQGKSGYVRATLLPTTYRAKITRRR